jgi:mycothiol system anti-sigma-R factor
MSDLTSQPESSSSDRPGAPSPCNAGGGVGDCEEALHDLYGYLDGEITAERRELIRVHIDECGPCLEAFDFEFELRELVARTCHSEAPESLRARIAAAIRDCDAGEPDPGPHDAAQR